MRGSNDVFLAEHLHADHVFLQLVPRPATRLQHDEVEEPLEPIDLPERHAREDALEMLADGIVDRAVDGVRRRSG